MDQKGIGHLQVIYGPMFSGKTTEMMRRVKRYYLSKYKCLLIRYAKDNRYSNNEVATHDGKTAPAVSTQILRDVSNLTESYNVIGIDEGQFFPDIVSFCKEQLHEGKIVIVSALDGTFQREGFGDILNLIPLAKTVDKLSAVCMSCGSKASFTKRIVNNEEVELIGGADMYMAVCRTCYKS